MEGLVVLINALVPVISGPAAAVAICLLFMYGAGYVLVKHILPEQRTSLDKVLADSAETRKIFQQAVEIFDERFRSIEKNVSAVKKDVDKIERDISDIKMKI
jgi:hypothetical protein